MDATQNELTRRQTAMAEREKRLKLALEGRKTARDALVDALVSAELDHHKEAILRLAKPCIGVGAYSPDGRKAGSSKFGGLPDLPEKSPWPTRAGRPLSFLAQINTSELSGYDCASTLPKRGLLSFFYDYLAQPWGFDPADRDGWTILFSDLETETELRQRNAPKGITKDELFDECRLVFHDALSLPTAYFNEAKQVLRDDDAVDRYIEIVDGDLAARNPTGCQHQLLGLANPVQDNMELECQLVSHGIYCGDPEGRNDRRVEELRAGASDWRLLFQIDSDEDGPGWMWGDTGMLYFWIRADDLANKRFKNVWTILQCH